MRRFPIIIALSGLFIMAFLRLNAQSIELQSPLNIPIYLSGNFGELRYTHFHAGIDIKTEGVTGKPVSAVKSGYVSRFKVQAGGYGHALYVTHDDGYTSVYGHLEEFYPELEAYLKELQYSRKTYELDIYPEKDKFKVERGQLIGISGNTGRSGGPHLHLELRDRNQVPVNLLRYNLPIKDTISPKFRKLVVYNNFDERTYSYSDKRLLNVAGSRSVYRISKPIEVGRYFAFGTEVYDYLNGSQNKCGIYKLDFFFDQTLIYSFSIDKISFKETKYIKSHLDYAEKKMNKINVHKLFREPNNNLSIYKKTLNNGILELNDTLLHEAKIVASDAYGNISTLSFKVLKRTAQVDVDTYTGDIFIPFASGGKFSNENFSFEIPAMGIYSNKWLNYKSESSDSIYYSDIHSIGDEFVAVNKFPQVKIKLTKPLNNLLPEKLVVVNIDHNGEIESEGGWWSKGYVSAKVSGFGKYAIMADTLPPEILSVSFKSSGWYAANDIISFRIIDELSGINTYNAYIDGEWALFEYDAKTDLLFYQIDSSKLEKSKTKHKLDIYVLDECNNMQHFASGFYY